MMTLYVSVYMLVVHREDPGFRVPYGQTGWSHGSGDGHSQHSYGGFPPGSVSEQCNLFYLSMKSYVEVLL